MSGPRNMGWWSSWSPRRIVAQVAEADGQETELSALRLVVNAQTAQIGELTVEYAGAVRRWQAAEADQAEGHARIVELETQLAEAQRDAGHAYVDRDRAIRRASAAENEPHVLELARLRQAVDAYQNRPSSLDVQDRRNAVVLCDALALSEGRKQGVGYARPADPETVERLLAAVRETVSQVLRPELERAS